MFYDRRFREWRSERNTPERPSPSAVRPDINYPYEFNEAMQKIYDPRFREWRSENVTPELPSPVSSRKNYDCQDTDYEFVSTNSKNELAELEV
jgi:hypothetical protein